MKLRKIHLALFVLLFLFVVLKCVLHYVIESKKNAMLIEMLGEIPELDLVKAAEKLGWTSHSGGIDNIKRDSDADPLAVFLNDNIVFFIYNENQKQRIEIRKIEFR